jgi:hypothetical protein
MIENGRRCLEVVIEVSTQAFADIAPFFRKHGFFAYYIKDDYSAASYIGEYETKRPDRLEVAPKGAARVDVICSRVDAASLP